MTDTTRFVATLSTVAIIVASRLVAQQPAPADPAQVPARGGGQGRGNIQTFPAQQRPPGDPALIARGGTVYGIECRSCHGADLRGGDLGGPNLLRSQVVLNDQDGELFRPIINGSRQGLGMPAIKMSDEDVKAVAAYVHSIVATARGQGAPPAGPPVVLNVLVGNATAGQSYFAAKCSACHSPTGDLAGIAAREPDATQLQNLWVSGGSTGRGRGAGAGPARAGRREVTATVTLPGGQKVEGRLDRMDDFTITVTPDGEVPRTFRRDGDVPRVDVHDPLAGHQNLLPVYTDRDIHDVTAYLATLK
jgi:cytochrome c oxidase cbb3-type subunit 3